MLEQALSCLKCETRGKKNINFILSCFKIVGIWIKWKLLWTFSCTCILVRRKNRNAKDCFCGICTLFTVNCVEQSYVYHKYRCSKCQCHCFKQENVIFRWFVRSIVGNMLLSSLYLHNSPHESSKRASYCLYLNLSIKQFFNQPWNICKSTYAISVNVH